MDDAQIIQNIRAGDQNGFKEIVSRYRSLVAATVIGMLGNAPEAEDVAQEVFIRFYKNITLFRGEASVGTYLTRIAINLSINEIRRRKRWKNHFISQDPESLQNISDNAADHATDESELIHQAINQLPPKFRSVIVLRLIDGFSTEKTAEILQIPLGTVLSRLTRGQKKLQKVLSPLWEKHDG